MIRDVGYLSRREDVQWFAWTIDAIRLLNRAGFLVCVTTNQGGIGLGFYDERFVRAVHQEMSATLDAAGARVDGWYFCPHHPRAVVDELRVTCECRKPRPGMIRKAAAEHAIDFARSYVVGDKSADVGLAVAVGAKAVLVKTGYGASELERHRGPVPGTAHIADTLLEAASWILLDAGFPKEKV